MKTHNKTLFGLLIALGLLLIGYILEHGWLVLSSLIVAIISFSSYLILGRIYIKRKKEYDDTEPKG